MSSSIISCVWTSALVQYVYLIFLLVSILPYICSACPSVDCKCTDLHIDCSNWNIKKVPIFYFDNVTYETVDVSENKIRRFKSRSFEELHVREVIINRNTYPYVQMEPKAFKGLEDYLESVQIRQSKLSSVPNGLFRNFVRLRSVDLSNNHLETLGVGTFKGCRKLQTLVARNNMIEKVDSTVISGLRRLRYVDLANNHIRVIDAKAFSGLRLLEELDLSDNNIRDLQPKTFKVY